MKILEFDIYMDGGTIEVTTDLGVYCFDDRIGSSTTGRVYIGYPENDNSNLILNSTTIEDKILGALANYDENNSQSIKHFIDSRRTKIKYVDGDLVRNAEQFELIAHGANCFCTMGSGIAPQIKAKFPEAYEVDCATTKGDKDKLGTITYTLNTTPIVVNCYSQYNYTGRKMGIMDLDYDALRASMKLIKTHFSGKKIGLPLIGCGLAGGDESLVIPIIEEELEGEDVTIVRYKA